MNLFFLPFVRQGLTPAANAGARANVSVSFRLESAGQPARDVSRTLALAGPGDVLGIEPRQVLRVSPAAGARDAEPDFFPLIEFDAPELPWAYSPTLPAGSRLAPWLVLVVVEADPSVRLERGAQGQSPWVLHLPADVARRELPDLGDAATWAHAQIACETSAQIDATLAAHPDRTLSRLLAPRRLHPDRGFIAAVVPTYLSGRIAGLGEIPPGIPRSSPDSSLRGPRSTCRRGCRPTTHGHSAPARPATSSRWRSGCTPCSWTQRESARPCTCRCRAARLDWPSTGKRRCGCEDRWSGGPGAPRRPSTKSARRCAAARTRRSSGPRTSASRGRTRARWRP